MAHLDPDEVIDLLDSLLLYSDVIDSDFTATQSNEVRDILKAVSKGLNDSVTSVYDAKKFHADMPDGSCDQCGGVWPCYPFKRGDKQI